MMNSDDPFSRPAVLPTYQPYLYQSGRFQTYGIRSWTPYSAVPFRPQAGEFLAPPIRPAWDRLFTVEQIVAHGYLAVPYAAPESALLSDKLHASRMGLEDLVSQIRSRISLYQKNVQELTYSQCEANNAVFRQEADQGHPADARQRYSASKRLQDLYQEQREERVGLWKDISRLRLAFPELAQSYLASYRKVSLLDDLSGQELPLPREPNGGFVKDEGDRDASDGEGE
jgi:hypothetical protein